MKLKKSDINILIGVLGIVLAVCSYFFVFQTFNEKTDGLKVENAALQEEVDKLQEMADNKPFYESETARMDEEIDEMISHFPGEIRTEDQIMYAIKLENIYDIWAYTMGIEGPQLVQVAVSNPQPTNDAVVEDVGDGAVNDAVVATGGLKDTVFLYSSPFTLSYKTTYHSAKDVIRDIFSVDERMSITSLTLSYDGSTGALSGTINATNYTVSGTDYNYVSPEVNVRTGTADFFKSASVLILDGTLGSDNAEGEEGEAAEGEDTSAE